MTKMIKLSSKFPILVALFGLSSHQLAAQNNRDTLLMEYLHKSISLISKDTLDTFDLRYNILQMATEGLLGKNLKEISPIIGYPIHIHKSETGNKLIFYPLSQLFIKDKGGSDLFVLFTDREDNIIIGSGYVYFIETEEEFYYWIDPNLPSESSEGSSNCPPRFRERH